MTVSQLVPWPAACPHDTQREGIRLGLILGVTTWLWIAVLDIATGQPFHSFAALGGIVVFTVIHLLLNVLYGITLISVIHSAQRAPSVMMGLIFVGITFEGAFAMFTNILVETTTLGNGAWLRIFVGNAIASVIAVMLLARTHPLLEYVHRAEHET
jgi:hypothetical protein